MYNLFVAYDNEAWRGESWSTDLFRCVREYTSDDLTQRFGDFTPDQINELRRFPCIFAYESAQEKDPHFGRILDVSLRQRRTQVRIEFELVQLDRFLTAVQLSEIDASLDIYKWEMNRTHWAVKDVDLARELQRHDIQLPDWARRTTPPVDVTTHQFQVALSFPGAYRQFVESIAGELERRLGPNSYFYDANYVAQLARPGLDTLLQDIYRNRAQLVVVFLCADYQNREWCGVEFRAIREMVLEGQNHQIMFIRLDNGEVEGVFRNDGYVDAKELDANTVAAYICERAALLRDD